MKPQHVMQDFHSFAKAQDLVPIKQVLAEPIGLYKHKSNDNENA